MRGILFGVVFIGAMVVPFAAGEHFLIPAPREVRVLVVGDMMFDRYIRAVGDRNGYESLFSCVRDLFQAHDVIIGNLEGPVTTNASLSQGASVGEPYNTRFTFNRRIPSVLAEEGVSIVSLGNNHIRDFGEEGILETRAFLDEAGIVYVGDPTDADTTSMHYEVSGIPLTVVAYNAFFGSVEDTIAHIKKGSTEGPVIVVAHWGDEYVAVNEEQKELARVFVAAGADAIFGSHPHVIQEVSYIEKAPVYYSLGNFIFDQYFSDEVMRGLGVSFVVSADGITDIVEIPFVLQEQNALTCPT